MRRDGGFSAPGGARRSVARALVRPQPRIEAAALGDKLCGDAVDLRRGAARLALEELWHEPAQPVSALTNPGASPGASVARPRDDGVGGVAHRDDPTGGPALARAHRLETGVVADGPAHHVGVDPREVGDADVDTEVVDLHAQHVQELLEARLRGAVGAELGGARIAAGDATPST